MPEIILHHYAGSPFAEKVRRVLAFKALPWRSVEVSVTMPRPDLTELTGGYRRVPVLQIGADIFCDTNLMMRVLEEVKPEPTLYPDGSDALSYALSNWFEPRMFLHVSPTRFQAPDDMAALSAAAADPVRFAKDRGPFMAPLMDTRTMGEKLPAALRHLRSHTQFLDRQLAASGAFLCGNQPCHADFSAYHALAWLRTEPNRLKDVTQSAAIDAWLDRIAAMSGPHPQSMTPGDALEVARACEPDPRWVPPGGEWAGRKVSVQPMDYGLDPMHGTLAGEDADRLSIARTSEVAGNLTVHFPQWGYDLRKA